MIGIFDLRNNNHIYFGSGISKVSKIATEVEDAVASSVEKKSQTKKSAKYMRSTIFNLDRGVLKDADLRLVNKIEESVALVNKRLSKIKTKEEKERVTSYKNLLSDPFSDKTLEFKVNSPYLTSISGRKVKLQGDGEVFFELKTKGFFSGGNKYLINSEGEIMKRPAVHYAKDAAIHKYDEPEYYSQSEINNLGINKELTLFNTELEKFNEHINNLDQIDPAAENLLRMANKNQNQNYSVMITTFDKKFQQLKNSLENIGIKHPSTKRMIASECKFRISKGTSIMQLNDINEQGDSVLLSIHSVIGKKAVKVEVWNDDKLKNIFLVKDNFIVKSNDVPTALKTPYYKQISVYGNEELKDEGILKLLDDIEKRMDSSYKTMKSMFGEDRITGKL